MIIPKLAFFLSTVGICFAMIIHTFIMNEHLQIKALSEKTQYNKNCFRNIAICDILMKIILISILCILVIWLAKIQGV